MVSGLFKNYCRSLSQHLMNENNIHIVFLAVKNDLQLVNKYLNLSSYSKMQKVFPNSNRQYR